jgi:hypothetical protein
LPLLSDRVTTQPRLIGNLNLGTFGETVSPEHQLHWIFENCRVVRAANGVSVIVEALKIANHKHDLLWYLIISPTNTPLLWSILS